jgi:Flp pilus assembly pilin Flp
MVFSIFNASMGRMRSLARLTAATRRFAADERGATAIEYAVLASFIAVAIAATVWNLGTEIKQNFYDKLAAMF